jgi:hypothetical protein
MKLLLLFFSIFCLFSAISHAELLVLEIEADQAELQKILQTAMKSNFATNYPPVWRSSPVSAMKAEPTCSIKLISLECCRSSEEVTFSHQLINTKKTSITI